ncbi:hypothetical protein [uncultured Methanobrevibacter sp.]|uniref:hypothetical protein n=1 Tax=uncultured Methanobrevibacter sp. TaxID=253161 RepID=UPI0032092461
MRCKYNNSMYTLDIPENMEFDEFDIYEDVQEPVDDIDYSFADLEDEDSAHLQKLVSEFDPHLKESDD